METEYIAWVKKKLKTNGIINMLHVQLYIDIRIKFVNKNTASLSIKWVPSHRGPVVRHAFPRHNVVMSMYMYYPYGWHTAAQILYTYARVTSFWHKVCGAWWRHQMETFSALLALCAGNSPITGEFPSPRSVTRSFDISFDLRLNKRLSKHSRDAGDLRYHRAHYDVTVLESRFFFCHITYKTQGHKLS